MEWRRALAAVVLGVSSLPAAGIPPALPVINPAAARLDATIDGLDGPAAAIAYCPRLGVLGVGDEAGAVRFWGPDVCLGVRAGRHAPDMLQAHRGPVTCMAWGCDSVLATAGADGRIAFWSFPARRLGHTLSPGWTVRALAWTPDGRRLAAAGDSQRIYIWAAAAGKEERAWVGHSDWIQCLAFSHDGRRLASGGYDGRARVWDATSGKMLLEVNARTLGPPAPAETDSAVTAAAFSPDDSQFALGGSDGQILLVSASDGKPIRTLTGHAGAVTSLEFHPGGAALESSSKDRTVRLWSPANGQPLKILEAHEAWVQAATFLAKGTRLASAGADRTLRLWDLAAPR